MNRTPEMCKNRRARPMGDTTDGWWYVDPGSITVHAIGNNPVTSVRLTRKQLERALEIMRR